MTPTEARSRVEHIRLSAGDAEAAHHMEDKLRADVLRAIADGDIPKWVAVDLARVALSTAEIRFARWCG